MATLYFPMWLFMFYTCLYMREIGAVDGKNNTDSEILKQLLNTTVYEKRLRPGSGGPPLIVNSTMYVVSLGPVSEVDMTFRLGLYFRQYWVDERLTFDNDKPLVLSQDLLSELWLPDSFFQTETESYVHEVTKRNVFFRLHQNGSILMSMRVTVTSRCPMDLTYFPMDTQTCNLRVASWGYTADDMQYFWMKSDSEPIVLADDILLANFNVTNCTHTSWNRTLSTGNWSTLGASFMFGRNTLYFIIQMYIPSTLIVMVSWVSFWVGRASVPARAALGITTVLTLLTLISSTNANMPKISYMKAIDVYFAGCFMFVFASLIEFAAVCYLDKPRKPVKIRYPTPKDFQVVHSDNSLGSRGSLRQNMEYSATHDQHFTPFFKLKKLIKGHTVNKPDRFINVGAIDRFSRYFFPITFAGLCITYIVAYTLKSKESMRESNTQ